jgi:hypothetical protein
MAEVAVRGIVECLRSHPRAPERMRRLELLIAQQRGKQPQLYLGENFTKRLARSRQEFSGERISW